MSWHKFLGFRFFGSKVSGLGFRVCGCLGKSFLGFMLVRFQVPGLGFSFLAFGFRV